VFIQKSIVKDPTYRNVKFLEQLFYKKIIIFGGYHQNGIFGLSDQSFVF